MTRRIPAFVGFANTIVNRTGPYLIEEWSADRQLVIFTVADGEHSTVDAWARAVKTAISEWPSDRACLLLHDLHKCGLFAFDANMQQRILELRHFKGDVKRHTALVVPDRFTAEIAELFVKVQELRFNKVYPVHSEVFLARKDGFIWLRYMSQVSPNRVLEAAVSQ